MTWPYGIPPMSVALVACYLGYWLARRYRWCNLFSVWLLALVIGSLFFRLRPWLSPAETRYLADLFVAGAACGGLCGSMARLEIGRRDSVAGEGRETAAQSMETSVG